MAQHCRICKQEFSPSPKMPRGAAICAKCRAIVVPCKCGCGGQAYLYGYDGKVRQGFLPHHYSRTETHKQLWAKNRPPAPHGGKSHSKETKREMSLARRGHKNSNWKGGLTQLVKGIRRSPEYHQWKKAVLERDKHKCGLCGSEERIHAHHKLSIIEYPEEIFNVKNGMTLCEKCHKAIHQLKEE